MKKCHVNRLYHLPAYAVHDKVGWSRRHLAAVTTPAPGFETALVAMLKGWLEYADVHAQRYDSTIGEDRVLGPAWARIGAALRDLLNGDLGRMDGGTLDALLVDTLEAQEFNPDHP
jgi:hypothetical protein